MKNAYYKSNQTAYNNATQAFAEAGTTINVLGNLVCDTGCSIRTLTGGFSIQHTGLYRLSYDVTYEPSAAGIVSIGLYNGTSALPCAVVQNSVASGSTYTSHVETILRLPVCCALAPNISAIISGVAGTITHVCASVTRLA